VIFWPSTDYHAFCSFGILDLTERILMFWQFCQFSLGFSFVSCFLLQIHFTGIITSSYFFVFRDVGDRDRNMLEAASTAASYDFSVKDEKIVISYRNIHTCTINFYVCSLYLLIYFLILPLGYGYWALILHKSIHEGVVHFLCLCVAKYVSHRRSSSRNFPLCSSSQANEDL